LKSACSGCEGVEGGGVGCELHDQAGEGWVRSERADVGALSAEEGGRLVTVKLDSRAVEMIEKPLTSEGDKLVTVIGFMAAETMAAMEAKMTALYCILKMVGRLGDGVMVATITEEKLTRGSKERTTGLCMQVLM
jgi:hypothetical protein